MKKKIMALEIFCTTIKYYRILDKLQSFIKPLGLGEEIYPENWFDEKKGIIFLILINIMQSLPGFIGYGKIN